MATKPGMTTEKPRNETAIAIGASLVIGLVLATILTGNPFHAIRLAYTDYSTPAAAAKP